MNWPRMILDGSVMALLFNAVVGLGFLLYPQAYSTMFPKEIREAAAPFVDRKEVRKMKLILYPLYLLLFVYWAVSAVFAGVSGFWHLFWTGYLEMTIVSASDFLILDCWLPPKARPISKARKTAKHGSERNGLGSWRSRSTPLAGHFSSVPLPACSSQGSQFF